MGDVKPPIETAKDLPLPDQDDKTEGTDPSEADLEQEDADEDEPS